jgi:hypothetical protein
MGIEIEIPFNLFSKNEKLSNDIVFLAKSLGFHSTITKCKKTIKDRNFVGNYFRISITGDCSIVPSLIHRKKCSKRSEWKNTLVTGIKEIKSIGIDEYYGFTLDGNGRYVTEDFMVTHNSLLACLIQMWKFWCFPRQKIVLAANSKDQTKFVHFDIIREVIWNSPVLLREIGADNIQEKEIRFKPTGKGVSSFIRPMSSYSGIVSNITGYTFSEIFDMKKPRFFTQLDGSIRNIPNALGTIDSTVSAKTHILYQLYQSFISHKLSSIFFSYYCSKLALQEDYHNPNMTQTQLDDYKS